MKTFTHPISCLLALVSLAGGAACQSTPQGPSVAPSIPIPAQKDPSKFSEAQRLRGSITPERSWWNLLHYDLELEILPETKSLKGTNTIRFLTLQSGRKMQIDLQEPLKITRVQYRDRDLAFERTGDVYWITYPWTLGAGVSDEIKISYEGVPTESKNPPWSGGLTWNQDKQGKPFIATTCQGIGASIWWPNKDHGYDEPDQGMDIVLTVPEDLVAVSNGRLIQTEYDPTNKLKVYHWRVVNPINNYGVNANIGNYVSIDTAYEGEFGKLDMQYWVLEQDKERAEKHFVEAPRTIEAFEYWFGKYPFYEDGYKLVEVPYLGMEHQSSVTYGNGFQNGYRGRDLSGTGVGLLFDYIIVHETAHEWWGNNISIRDTADLWIHEGFGTYAENLFIEYHFSEEQAQDYLVGTRKRIGNKTPIIGTYGFNDSGSGDMYPKGAAMLHTMRYAIGDTEKWRGILRGLNQTFWHKTITTAELEAYMSKQADYDFGPFFDQYLRTTAIPVVKYLEVEGGIQAWFENVVKDFHLPVVLRINGEERRVELSRKPTRIALDGSLASFEVDRNFYMTAEAYAPPVVDIPESPEPPKEK